MGLYGVYGWDGRFERGSMAFFRRTGCVLARFLGNGPLVYENREEEERRDCIAGIGGSC